jgi:hypothetical protein
MVRSLAEMAAKGQRKLSAKAPTMKASYDAAKARMKAGYAAMPFGPRRKAAYAAGVDAGVYTAPDPAKWARNWTAKMSE